MSETAGAAVWPLVVTVVLNWRHPEETLACVRTLHALDYPNQRILVIDNDAGSSGIEALLAGLPVRVIRNPANLGFTGGVNVGLRAGFAEDAAYVWLFNSDATAAPDALRHLVAAAEADPRIGLASPVFHHPDAPDAPAFLLGLFDRRSLLPTGTHEAALARQWLRERPGDIVLYGTALLVRRALFDAAGAFDERFFAYHEDIEYSLRCHRSGFRPAVCFEAKAYHPFKSARDMRPYVHYLMTRNIFFLWRTLPQRRRAALRPGLWFVRRCLGQIMNMQDDPAGTEAILAGLWDGIRGITGPYRPGRRAPWWLRHTLGRHPVVFADLLDRRLPRDGHDSLSVPPATPPPPPSPARP